jgi:Zn-finger nucleic acid-binding protein
MRRVVACASDSSPVCSMTSTLRCPRSSTHLTSLRIGGVDTDVCEDCGGVWLDRLELEKFDHAGSAFGDALVAHLRQFPPALMDHSVRLRCPHHAHAVMLRRAYSRDVRIEIDECPQCGGIWLDADELEQIRQLKYTSPPGSDS